MDLSIDIPNPTSVVAPTVCPKCGKPMKFCPHCGSTFCATPACTECDEYHREECSADKGD